MLKDFRLPRIAQIYTDFYFSSLTSLAVGRFRRWRRKNTDEPFFILVLLQQPGLYFRFGNTSLQSMLSKDILYKSG
jgi:hypothetical protein